jgi:hypothetical protein
MRSTIDAIHVDHPHMKKAAVLAKADARPNKHCSTR